MKIQLLSFSAVALAFLVTPASWMTHAQTKPPLPSKDEAKLLLEAAVEKTHLSAVGSPPYHLRAKVKSFASKRDTIEGTYEVWWASPERWREETIWDGKTSVKIADTDHLWTEGEDLHRYIASRLLDLLDFWAYLKISRIQEMKRVHAKTFDGASLACVEVDEQIPETTSGNILLRVPAIHRTACLDPGTSLPLRIERNALHLELSNYVELGAKRFPRTLRRIFDGKSQIEAEVEILEAFDAAQAGTLQPSKSAVSQPWCSNMVPPIPVHFGGAPDLSVSLSSGLPLIPLPPDIGRLGLLIFDVDATGHTLDVKAFQRDGRVPIKDSDKRTLLRSVFKPATCQGMPMWAEFEMGPTS